VSPVGLRIVANRRVDGTALRQARLTAGLTMSEVAEAVGVGDGARIGAWEHGLEQPHPRFIPKLAKVVELPVMALLIGKGLEPSLADLRVTKGLTLTELASSAGIPRTTCHRLEQQLVAKVVHGFLEVNCRAAGHVRIVSRRCHLTTSAA
jgi:DNA-binding XRE family transcriptional regulator